MNILLIDACPRSDSRTRRLAEAVLSHLPGTVTTERLAEISLPIIDEKAADKRFADGKQGCFDAPVYDLAKEFVRADCLVLAAPVWDLSFPALLKQYIEAITVSGITFRYSQSGVPIGLCRAKALYYITTAGGVIVNDAFGYGYIKALAQGMYGIENCHCFQAERLDILGEDVEKILARATDEIAAFFSGE